MKKMENDEIVGRLMAIRDLDVTGAAHDRLGVLIADLAQDKAEPKKYVPLKMPLYVHPSAYANSHVADMALAVGRKEDDTGWLAFAPSDEQGLKEFKQLIWEHAKGREAIELLERCFPIRREKNGVLKPLGYEDRDNFLSNWQKGPQDDRD